MAYRFSIIGAERENLDLRRHRLHFCLRAFSLILNGLGRILGDPFEIVVGVDSEKRRRVQIRSKRPGGATHILSSSAFKTYQHLNHSAASALWPSSIPHREPRGPDPLIPKRNRAPVQKKAEL